MKNEAVSLQRKMISLTGFGVEFIIKANMKNARKKDLALDIRRLFCLKRRLRHIPLRFIKK